MNGALMYATTAAAIIIAAAYPAYADDFSASLQDAVDITTDLRNDYLAETFFGESSPTPRIAAVETVERAIDLYESTRADPHVPVTERGTFVRHPINPYGTTVVAFEVINSMNAREGVYPFVIDFGTLEVLAEGAFPATVGLYAVFLDDADRPLEDILEDIQESDGTWVTYTFTDPSTGRDESKHTWLSLYDGYIFGAGYSVSLDDAALDDVRGMVRTYDADGTDSFEAIRTDSDVSFVLDAGTLEVVAHTDPDTSGSAIEGALDANWDLETLSAILDRHERLWVSYPTPDPRPGSEFTRAHLQLHDGYIFGSGYGLTPEARLQALTSESVQLYEMYGEDVYQIITSMEGTLQLVADPEDNKILGFADWPDLVGLSIGDNFYDQEPEAVLQYLSDHAGLWLDSVDPLDLSSTEMRRSSWFVLHDGHLFGASQVYSPEEVSIGKVDAAIALYKTHGEKAFDHITWQSVRPEIIYPFAHVAQTWELVAHAAVPERVGVCCAAPIAASNDLDAARQALEENPGIWLEYTFYNPISERYEYKRSWFSTYDGYTFAAGYYYGNFEQLERAIQEAIDLYDAEGGNAAFASVNAMMEDVDYPIILDGETLEVVAHGQNSALVGTDFFGGAVGASILVDKIKTDLRSDGDTTIITYNVFDLATTSVQSQTVLAQLHDGYIFAAEQPFVVYTR